jgi:ABC-type antimicrobial peptide transport system permease subunit
VPAANPVTQAAAAVERALGAQRYDVFGLVMREAMLVVAGIAIGLAAALAAGRFVASLLFDLARTDALTMIASIAPMIIVSALAGICRLGSPRASIRTGV